ncbi:MAG TPA: preprotein translocase subunit SecY [Candidatus Nealsonbacteria bacterium]|uniref:Protein translocase subunit SecY n=1 Tax=marine sediment metagenome TaxID=412755 RepID=A0A0F9XU00_9ZZZZ|nr:preprotein translocase subunit SecY [Candidatus Nealsonbacteria bacterium]HEB46345.1 preprotein translocase subunit SecY [Candidatus Nealsonbacteria bacterium]
MWYQKIIQVFKIKDLRNKILFILAIFAIFRIMATIPIPGIDAQRMREFFESNQLFGLLNIFTGGALDNLSIVMLGLGPYITSVIILQLLTMIFPQLERLYKEEGEQGRQKFNQYGRLLTVPFAALQGYAMLALFQQQNVIGTLSPQLLLTAILTIIAGAVFLMWLGELISEKGIGNGISLMIFAGIVSGFPNNIRQLAISYTPAQIPSLLLFFGMAVLIIAGVVLINEARRNIPVSYAKRVRGMKMYGGASTYLPLNVNPAGVIPIIFALSILLFPGMIANFLSGAGGIVGNIAQNIGAFFDPQQNLLGYVSIYFILVILFTFFYTAVTFDPKSIASNLQKMGGFIPGIRPGRATADFLHYILNRVLVIGAVSLGLIAVMPFLVQAITDITVFGFLVGGTSLIIVVSVVLETMRQIRAQLQMREYETF